MWVLEPIRMHLIPKGEWTNARLITITQNYLIRRFKMVFCASWTLLKQFVLGVTVLQDHPTHFTPSKTNRGETWASGGNHLTTIKLKNFACLTCEVQARFQHTVVRDQVIKNLHYPDHRDNKMNICSHRDSAFWIGRKIISECDAQG